MAASVIRIDRLTTPRPAKQRGRPVGRPARAYSADATREGILAAAAKEFALHGFSGARVDVITAQTNTSKRMIYYYFGSKEELYRRVLQESYRALRLKEAELELDGLMPLQALEKIVEFNFDHHAENEHFIRMVMNENVLLGKNIREIPGLKSENSSVIELLRDICSTGEADGSMRPGIDPVDLHMSISALCVFSIANRHTFSFIFDCDMTSATALAARRRSVVEIIVGGVTPRLAPMTI